MSTKQVTEKFLFCHIKFLVFVSTSGFQHDRKKIKETENEHKLVTYNLEKHLDKQLAD